MVKFGQWRSNRRGGGMDYYWDVVDSLRPCTEYRVKRRDFDGGWLRIKIVQSRQPILAWTEKVGLKRLDVEL